MGLFTDTLLTDLSAAEVAAQLAERGVELSGDEVETRCRQLEGWGNLVRSVTRQSGGRVSPISCVPIALQVSKLGGRVQGRSRSCLRATTGVREVARELLAAWSSLSTASTAGSPTRPDLSTSRHSPRTSLPCSPTSNCSPTASATSTPTCTRSCPATTSSADEYAAFKELLLSYVDLITADVARHSPAVTVRAEALIASLDTLLGVLATLPTLANPDGSPAERLPGRVRADWEEFAAWYGGHGGRSGPQQLRTALSRPSGSC